MGPAEDIEKMVKQKKLHLSTSTEMDKQSTPKPQQKEKIYGE